MSEDWPERPEMEDMRRLVELYARGQLPPDVLTSETRRYAVVANVMQPVRRWFVGLRARRMKVAATADAAPEVEISFHRAAR